MVVANGREKDVLRHIVEGEETGTLFAPSAKKRSSRSRWITAVRPSGFASRTTSPR